MPAISINHVRRAACEVMPKHGVGLAYLYGSQTTGQATPLSDVDVAVVTDDELPPRDRLRLELTLETELAALCEGDFDVRIINAAPLAVNGTVVQTGHLLYARADAARVAFEATVRDRYFDFLPVLEQHRQAYFRASRAALQERETP